MPLRLSSFFTLIAGITLAGVNVLSGASASPSAIVRHGPSLNGGLVEGSLQVLSGESFNVNSGFTMTGDVFVPGTPHVVFNGNVTHEGVLVGDGSPEPVNYTVRFNSGVTFGYLVTRTDPVTIPSVPAVANPVGNRSVNINQAGQSPGEFATLRNLTLNSNVGVYDIPPGDFGHFIANSTTGFRLGAAGGTSPVIYNFESLTLNSNSVIELVGPVVIRVKNSIHLNGVVGSSAQSNMLWFELPTGGVTLNSGSRLYGNVMAPGGHVIINHNAVLEGSLECDRFTLNNNGVLRLRAANQPPTADGQALSTGFGESLPITLTGSDPEGDPLSYFVIDPPANGSLSGNPPNVTYTPASGYGGMDSFTFGVSDGLEDSAPATVLITITLPPAEGEPDFFILNEGDALTVAAPGVLANDPSGSPGTLTAEIGALPVFGALQFNSDGGFVYQPAPGFFGDDLFTYRPVVDAAPGQLTPVSLYVNARPRPTDRAYVVPQNTPVNVHLEAFDPDDLLLDFNLETSPMRGVLLGEPASQDLQYVPNWQASGPDEFTFRVSDPLNASAIGTIALTLNPANTPPVAIIAVAGDATGPPFAVSFDGQASYDLDGSIDLFEWDFDGDGIYDAEGPVVETSFPLSGLVSPRLRVTDNSGATSVSIMDLSLNQPPTAAIVSPAALTGFTEGDVISVEGTGVDQDGYIVAIDLLVNGAVTASVESAWASFDLSGLGPGEYLVEVRAVDDGGASGLSSVVPFTVLPSLASSGNFVVHPNLRVAELPAVPGFAEGGVDEITSTLPLFADNYFSSSVGYTVELLNDRTSGETGYIVQDSDTSPDVEYVWEEISATGLRLEATDYDDYYSPAALSFSFPFFDQTFDQVFVGSNGLLSFVDQSDLGPINTPLPNPSAAGYMIAAFWTDLLPGLEFEDQYSSTVLGASAIYGQDFGDRFVIQYSADAEYWGPLGPEDDPDAQAPENNDQLGITNYNRTGRYTFQIVLHRSGDIDFVYRWMGGNSAVATIGIQNADGTDGVQLAFNEPFVTNHRTFRLKREARGDPWFTVEDVDGSLLPGGHDDMAVRFHSGLDFPTGVYAGQIRVNHDQPGLPPYVVDVGLNLYPKDPVVGFTLPDPKGRNYFFHGETVPVQVAASDEDGLIRAVWVTANDEQIASWNSGPFTFPWSPADGEYSLVAYAMDNDGRVSASEPLEVSFSVDSDGNNLPDDFELDYLQGLYGLGPLYDWNGDGLTLRKELWLGLNPNFVNPIAAPNLPPVARLVTERLSGEAPFVVRFDARQSYDLDGGVVAWHWDFNGDDSIDSEANLVEWTFPVAGNFPVTLFVTDDEGEMTTASISIHVRPAGTAVPPVAAFDASVYAAPAARAIEFDALASADPDGTIESYAWDFGDGFTSSESTPTHYYDRVGIHPVRLTVTDEDGLTSSIEKYVTITHADRGVFAERNGFLVLEAEYATTFDPRNDRFAWRLARSGIDRGDWGAQLEYAGDDFRPNPPDDPIDWEDGAEIAWRVRITTPGLYYYAARYTTAIRDPDGSLHWRVGFDGNETGPSDGDPIGHSESSIRWRRGVSLGFLEAGEHTIQIRRAGDLAWLDQIAIALDKEALPGNQTVAPGLPGSIRPNLPVAPPTARIESHVIAAELPVEILLDGTSSTAARGGIAGYNWIVQRSIDPVTGLSHDWRQALGTSDSLTLEIDDFNHPGERGDAFGPDGVEVELRVVDSFGQLAETSTYIAVIDPLESVTSPLEVLVDDGSPGFAAGLQWRASQPRNMFISGNYYSGGVAEYFEQLNQSPPAFGAIPVDLLDLQDWFGAHASFNFTSSVDPASFTPDFPVGGDYLVFLRWPRTSRALDPPIDPITNQLVGLEMDDRTVVEVASADGTTQYALDQRIGGGHWRFAGVHAFAAGSSGSVSIRPSEDRKVAFADAVRFLGASTVSANQAPVAAFSFVANEDGTVAFDGSASSDSDGSIIAWFWEFGDGTTSRAKRPRHLYSDSGDHTVTLTVIDDQLGYHKSSQTVNVPASGQNDAPVARVRFNAVRGEVPFLLETDGSLSTDDTGIVGYRWETVLEDEPWGAIAPFAADGELASFVFNKPGTYPVTLTVTDENGATDSTTLTIEAVARGVSAQAPLVVDNRDFAATFNGAWATYVPSTGQPWPVALGDGSEVVAGLTYGSDFAYATQVGDEAVFRPSLPHAGLYQVFLRCPVTSARPPLQVRVEHSGGESVMDYNHGIHAGDWQLLGTFLFGGGSQGSVSFAKDGLSQAVLADAVRWVPVGAATEAAFTFTFPSGSGAPALAAFDGTSSSSDVGIASYAWQFGDGGVGQGATVQHTYATAGTYVVTLSVTDSRGATTSARRFVRVGAALSPPNAVADIAPLAGARPLVVGFDGSSSSDPDGIAAFHWDLGDGQDFSGVAGSHRYDQPGTYTITLTVVDVLGASAQVVQTVQVDDASSLSLPRLDVASLDPSAGIIQYDAGGVPPGAVVSWDFGDGQSGTGYTATHQYAAPGAYLAILTINSGGTVMTVSRWITVGESQVPPDAPRSDPGAAFILYSPLAPIP